MTANKPTAIESSLKTLARLNWQLIPSYRSIRLLLFRCFQRDIPDTHKSLIEKILIILGYVVRYFLRPLSSTHT